MTDEEICEGFELAVQVRRDELVRQREADRTAHRRDLLERYAGLAMLGELSAPTDHMLPDGELAQKSVARARALVAELEKDLGK